MTPRDRKIVRAVLLHNGIDGEHYRATWPVTVYTYRGVPSYKALKTFRLIYGTLTDKELAAVTGRRATSGRSDSAG